MSTLKAKTIAAFSFLGISILGTIIGFFFQSNKKVMNFIPVANGFAGGALLSLWIFHILPEQSKEINEVHFGFYAGNFFYNISYFIIFGGFYLMLAFSILSHDDHIDTEENPDTLKNVKEENHTFNKTLCSQQVEQAELNKSESSAIIHVRNQESFIMKSGPTTYGKNLQKFFTFTKIPMTFALFGLGLAIHSFFEGFAAGNSDSSNSILISTGGLMVHKWIETLLLVLNYPRYLEKTISFWLIIAIASIGSPLGLFSDFFLSGSSPIIILIFSSLSTGILLFVVFHIISELMHKKMETSIYCLISFLCGSVIVLGLFVTSSHLEGKE